MWLGLPQLNADQLIFLAGPFIKQMKNDKEPSPEKFAVEWYKRHIAVAPILLSAYCGAVEQKSYPSPYIRHTPLS